jgi:hypothetical protein
MQQILIRNIPDATSRALQSRANQEHVSRAALIRSILERAVDDGRPIKVGSLLAELRDEPGNARLAARKPPPRPQYPRAQQQNRPEYILLDSWVLQQPLIGATDSVVTQWLDAHTTDSLYISAITIAHLRAWVMKEGDILNRESVAAELDRGLVSIFGGRIVAFDAAAAMEYVEVRARAAAKQLAFTQEDAMVAATAITHRLDVATLRKPFFEAVGVKVINPW